MIFIFCVCWILTKGTTPSPSLSGSPDDNLSPPLLIKLGMIKNFVKAMSRDGSRIVYLKEKLFNSEALSKEIELSALDYC